jgi:Holliday junction resolvase RusA-like endonuclease
MPIRPVIRICPYKFLDVPKGFEPGAVVSGYAMLHFCVFQQSHPGDHRCAMGCCRAPQKKRKAKAPAAPRRPATFDGQVLKYIPGKDLLFHFFKLPPSVNHYTRAGAGGKRLLTDQSKSFIAEVQLLLRGHQLKAGQYHIDTRFHLPEGMRIDGDNTQKLIWDAIKHAGVIPDDDPIVSWAGRKLVIDRQRRPHVIVNVVRYEWTTTELADSNRFEEVYGQTK